MFKNDGNIINGIINFTPREALDECKDGAVILDMRRPNEIKYKSFDVENIIFARPDEVKENYKNLPKDKPLIIADNAGIWSKKISSFLMEKGLENIANLAGGMFEWDKYDLPILINKSEQMNASCLCMMRPNRKAKSKNDK